MFRLTVFSQKPGPPPLCALSVSQTPTPPIAKPSHVCLQITPAIYSKRSHQQTRWPLDYHVLHIHLQVPYVQTSTLPLFLI